MKKTLEYIVKNLWKIYVLWNMFCGIGFGYLISIFTDPIMLPVSFGVSVIVTVIMEKMVKTVQEELSSSLSS